MKITVQAIVKAPLSEVWSAYTTPDDIKLWNAASDDWHTTRSTVDLRVGGAFMMNGKVGGAPILSTIRPSLL